MNSTNKTHERNEPTRQFAEIYRQYNDPIEIRKKQNAEKRETIKEDKRSSFVIYERI